MPRKLTARTCKVCKVKKDTLQNFKWVNSSATYSQTCNDCRDTPRKIADKLTCYVCKNKHPRKYFNVAPSGRIDKKCKLCKENKVTLKKDVKVKVNVETIDAKEMLKRVKEREAELLKNGAKYIKGDLRSYKLVR